MKIAAGLLLVSLTIAGCGGGEENARPTQRPTPVPPTPTARSTALPDVAEAPGLGTAERPIEMYFTVMRDASARQLANEVQREIGDETALEIAVELADETNALQALCSGRPVAAWVNAFTFVKAHEHCGAIPVLAVKRGTVPRVTAGSSAMIIAPNRVSSLSDMAGKVFCRSADHDFETTWVLPSLLLGKAGINPVTDLAEIKDLPNDTVLGIALIEGVCDAAALPPGELEDFLDDLAVRMSTGEQRVRVSDLEDQFTVLVEPGDTLFPANTENWQGYAENVIPYEVLVFSPNSSLPEDLRADISDALEAYFSDRISGPDRTRDLLDAEGVISVDQEDYSAFLDLLTSAKWDMTFSD